MSTEVTDGITRNTIINEENDEVIMNAVEVVSSLLAIGVVGDDDVRKAVLEEVANEFDFILSVLSQHLDDNSSIIIGNPLVDILELTDCVGPDTIYSALGEAINILLGSGSLDEGVLLTLSDCLGWEKNPESMNPIEAARAIIISLTGSLNKAVIKYSS